MEKYVYQELPTNYSFRVMHLEAESEGAELYCRIEHFRFTKNSSLPWAETRADRMTTISIF
jgi:hypothetical protein